MSRHLIFFCLCLLVSTFNVWAERFLISPEQRLSACRGGVGGEGRRRRRRPKQGYFYEAHNKDMEMKHLYATGRTFFLFPVWPHNLLSCFCSPAPVEDGVKRLRWMRAITPLSGEREQWGGSRWYKHQSESLQVYDAIFTMAQGGGERGMEGVKEEVVWKCEFIIHGAAVRAWTAIGIPFTACTHAFVLINSWGCLLR